MLVCVYVCMCVYVCEYVCISVCTTVCLEAEFFKELAQFPDRCGTNAAPCMFVCICVCMCVCMYGCAYVCVYVCMLVCMYVCMYVCMHVCMYVRMYACMYVCMYVHTYVCACMPQFWSVLSLELQNKIAKASRAHSMVHYGIYILEGIKESANPHQAFYPTMPS